VGKKKTDKLTEFLLGLIWAEIGVYEFYILGGTIEK
jgi:hypothetical protein